MDTGGDAGCERKKATAAVARRSDGQPLWLKRAIAMEVSDTRVLSSHPCGHTAIRARNPAVHDEMDGRGPTEGAGKPASLVAYYARILSEMRARVNCVPGGGCGWASSPGYVSISRTPSARRNRLPRTGINPLHFQLHDEQVLVRLT